MTAQTSEHVSVLLTEVIDLLRPTPDGVYVDGTLGLGGHSRAILSRLGNGGRLVCIDRDEESLALARAAMGAQDPRVTYHWDNYKNLPLILGNLQIQAVDGILVDLGVSRYQLTDPDRGFTFQEVGRLDMRMDQSQRLTAEELVNHLPLEQLTDLLRRLGEEPQAPKIARAIVERRKHAHFHSTKDLADLIVTVKGRPRRHAHHPATLVFQALRLAVNQELEGLDLFLSRAIRFLKPGGRLVVISFHSLEDRIVKRTFQVESGKCVCFQPGDLCTCPREKVVEILTKKPVEASSEEVQSNPSSRSAKLRAVERIGAAEALGDNHDRP